MANKFETATNNYGNYFSNNNGNHHYTTHGHKYDDSAYVLCYFPHQKRSAGEVWTWHNNGGTSITYTSTKNGYPANNVKTYVEKYDLIDHRLRTSELGSAYTDEYTDRWELYFPNNIDTKGSITNDVRFKFWPSTGSSISAAGGSYELFYTPLKYTNTRDTRGYRYVDVTITPNVYGSLDEDDGTDYKNAKVESTTYVGENRQGFFNHRQPNFHITLGSSYNGTPFKLSESKTIYDIQGFPLSPMQSVSSIQNDYTLNRTISYGYSPYEDSARWYYDKTHIIIEDNFLSTYPKTLTLEYDNYWNFSYDGGTFRFNSAFISNGTYQGVTTSTETDKGFTTYTRKTVLKIVQSATTHSSTSVNVDTSYTYTITQNPATLRVTYNWSRPAVDSSTYYLQYYIDDNIVSGDRVWYRWQYSDANYTSLGWNNIVLKPQVHYMGYVSGNLDNSLVSGQSSRVIYMDHGTSKEGTFGNLKWTDCENRTERFFNVRVSTKFDNCRNQNITSITNEYVSGDKRKPQVTLKCRQLPAHWNHPGIHVTIKSTRYVIPSDSRFDKINPKIGISTTSGWLGGTTTTYFSAGNTNGTNRIGWTISPHGHHLVSTVDNNNSKLSLGIYMPTISTPYIKSTVSGSISAAASTPSVGPTKSDITITPTWNVNYTRGYDKGFESAEWKYSFVSVEGYNDDPNSYGGDGMDCSGVTGFNDFVVHLNKCEDFNYRYPSITLTASTSNSTFTLGSVTTNTASDATSLADGAKSAGFTVSVPANPKTGSKWGASIVRTPTTTLSGTIRITSGDMKNSLPRSTTISFSNSFDTNLTSGSITNPSNITITQRADKWGGNGSIGLCFEIVEGKAGQALDGGGVCLIKSIPNTGSNQTYNDFSIGHLKERHQLVLTGIGTIVGSDKAPDYDVSEVTVTSTGMPASESSSDFTYTSTINAWCDDYSSIGTTYGPNGSNSKYVTKYTVSPISPSWKRQYKFDNTWLNSATLNIGTNIGSTTAASCVTNSNAINNGPFTFTPSRYNGSGPRTLYYRVGVYDNNSGALYENPTDYKIVQDGSDPYYNTSSFTFSSSSTRCAVNGLASSVSGNTVKTCGSFTVTPDTNPFTGDIAYTNGMVPGSHSNNITSGITSGSTTISKVGESNTNFDYGTTNPNKSIGVSGSSTIQWSTTGALKYKFYYNYTVTCSSGAKISSGDIESSEQTWTPAANVTNYTLKMRYLSPGSSSWTSWSTTLTTTANSMGTWKVQGGFFNGNTQYGSSTEYSFIFKTMGADYYEYRCTKINIKSDTPYTTKNATYTVTPTLTYTIQMRTLKGDGSVKSDWENTNYANGVTLNASDHTFTDMAEGQTYEYTFTASIASKISDSTSTDSNKSHKVSVYREYNTITENRTYCTMSVTNTYISAWDTSGTTSCTFTATKQYRTSSDGGTTWTDWVNNGTDNSTTINASSKKLTPTTMGSSSSTTSDTTYTFKLSGTNLVGTTSVNGHVYKYGKTYYNS